MGKHDSKAQTWLQEQEAQRTYFQLKPWSRGRRVEVGPVYKHSKPAALMYFLQQRPTSQRFHSFPSSSTHWGSISQTDISFSNYYSLPFLSTQSCQRCHSSNWLWGCEMWRKFMLVPPPSVIFIHFYFIHHLLIIYSEHVDIGTWMTKWWGWGLSPQVAQSQSESTDRECRSRKPVFSYHLHPHPLWEPS